MQAVICTRYGPPEVLQLTQVATPSPKANELLVKIHATTVTAGDIRIRSFNVPTLQWLPARLFLGLRKPRRTILGIELAGEVAAVGEAVTRFNLGDAVYALTLWSGFGGYAEYACLPEDSLVALKPHTIPYEEAAAVPVGGITALGMLRKANIQAGQQVLIYGASGSVGTYAVQLATHYGAQVTGVCSTANLEWVKGLGATAVIDYTHEDFTQGGVSYDLILDTVGKANPAQAKRVLKPTGTFISVRSYSDKVKTADLHQLTRLIEDGVLRAVIDRVYPLEQAVDAHRYVGMGHKKGNVVLKVV